MVRTFTTPEGQYRLTAVVVPNGPDLTVALSGGQAHLGAVAAASARPSLDDPTRTSADVTSHSFPGHKEDELARAMARHLAAALGCRVVVTAGAHWDDISPEGIAAVVTNAERLTVDMAAHYLEQRQRETEDDRP